MDRKRQLALVFATVGIALGAGHLVQGGAGGGEAAGAPRPTDVGFVSAGPEATGAEATRPKVTAGLIGGSTAPAAPRDIVAPAPVVTTEPGPVEPVPPPPAALATTGTDPLPGPVTIETPKTPGPAIPQQTSAPALPDDIAAPGASFSGAGSDAVATPAPAATFSGAGSDAAAPDAADPVAVPELTPAPPAVQPAEAAPLVPEPTTPAVVTPAVGNAAADCPVTLKIAAAPQAMIGVSVLAPCKADTRVLIDHMGLAITGRTDDAGSLFLSVPALAMDATVTAYVGDADGVSESVRIPAMATLRRFGVQWQSKDAFQLHAFENGANYGDTGHLSAADPRTPLTGAPPAGGYLTLLGDDGVALPQLAQIYTFPAGGTGNTDVVIEAAVTEDTCGRSIEGETIMTLAGEAYLTPLTLAMPDCDGVGDILVLKNLMTDLTIAAAN